jgi:hypothetical protein
VPGFKVMDWRLHMDLFCSIDLYKAGVVGFLYAVQ